MLLMAITGCWQEIENASVDWRQRDIRPHHRGFFWASVLGLKTTGVLSLDLWAFIFLGYAGYSGSNTTFPITQNNFGILDLLPEKVIGIFGFGKFGIGFGLFGFRESGKMPTLISNM